MSHFIGQSQLATEFPEFMDLVREYAYNDTVTITSSSSGWVVSMPLKNYGTDPVTGELSPFVSGTGEYLEVAIRDITSKIVK